MARSDRPAGAAPGPRPRPGVPRSASPSAPALRRRLCGTMIALDAWAIREAQRLPVWLTNVFDELTDFGKSGWF